MASTFLFISFVLSAPMFTQNNPAWEEIRSVAESQHEVIMLLIEKREYEKVPEAARKLFNLGFPKDQEHLLVEEATLLTDKLLHHNQNKIAHRVLDEALKATQSKSCLASLYKEKAFVYKREGKYDEALKAFQKSVELKQNP